MTKKPLYVVATPIGNLDDLSQRAIKTLNEVDILAVEDTRQTARLLNHFGIRKPMMSVHDHNERFKVEQVLQRLNRGESVALVSDAGTPLISDPGYPLVNAARAAGFEVVPIPGACALITALCAAGLPSDRFSFQGFLPAKSHPRNERLIELSQADCTQIFYESTHRIRATLEAIAALMPDRPLVLARELTKRFETFLFGNAQGILNVMEQDADQIKGEFVVMMAGKPKVDASALSQEDLRTLKILLPHVSLKTAAECASQLTGKAKKAFYQQGLALKNTDND